MNSFVRGIIFWVCCSSLLQDNLGKEEVIRKIQSEWIDSSITFPLALFILVWVIYCEIKEI